MRTPFGSMNLFSKILLSFGALLAILILSIAISLWQTNRVTETVETLTEKRLPMIQASLMLLSGVNRAISAQRGWVLSGGKDEKFKMDRAIAWDTEINNSLNMLTSLMPTVTDTETKKAIQDIFSNVSLLKQYQQEMENLFATDNKQAMTLFSTRVSQLVRPLQNNLKLLVERREVQVKKSAKEITSNVFYLNILEWIFLGLGLIIGTILSIRLARGISQPVIHLAENAQAIAKGDLTKEVKVTGAYEIQQLNQSFRNMTQTMKEVANVAKNISEGKYTATIQPRSEQDELVLALLNMTKTLHDNKIYYENQSWLQKGINQIVSAIAENSELEKLCTVSLTELSRYMEIGLGALYLFEEETQELKLVSSFAYTEREYLANHFNLGHGIVGQVALEQKPILLKNIKRHELVITTSLTEEAPVNIYTFPLIDKRDLIGVIELAFHEPITELKINFITNVSVIMASSIRVAKQKMITEKLLAEQQALTEELQTQQEELKAANEELETQTEELKTSEEELKMRDEEQRALNKELEEHNQLLEEQKRNLEKVQKEILEKTNELKQASKYKSEFLANMSHELRTPLNSLLLLSKLMIDNKDNNLTQEQLESLEIIHRSGQELLQLINDILDLAKVEAGKLKVEKNKIAIKNFVDCIKRDFQLTAKNKNIELQTEIEADMPEFIFSDEQRLKQILKNLLSNAFKFTEKGTVKLKAHKVPANTQLKLKDTDKAKLVAWSVSDTGVGIPHDKQELIFQTFYQIDSSTTRKYSGSGLGLSISAQLAGLLQGEIQLTSELDKGSCFTLYLPIDAPGITQGKIIEETSDNVKLDTAKETTTAKAAASPIAAPPTEAIRKTLLIIEDDVQFAKILESACQKRGYTCWIATSGKAGLELVEKKMPAGILLDVNLPDINGLLVANKIKQNQTTCHIPIHFISGMDKTEDAMKVGAAGYLMKPISIEQLDLAMQGVSRSINDQISSLLIVEDDETLGKEIEKTFTEKAAKVERVRRGSEALELLKANTFDCMVLDLGLPDISGFELLKTITENSGYANPAVIIYTGRELTEEEHELLQKYSRNIIVKGKASLDRLIDETALFLHRVEKNLPKTFSQEAPSLNSEDKFQGKKLLLVDDDMRNTFALASALKQYGLKIEIAPNGKVAIELLNKNTDFDGVLMDIMMPIMDGLEAIEKIRGIPKYLSLPIIALTAKTMSSDREKCLSVGATDYLAKPVDVDKLLILLRAWI